jgi:hypothetical protein
MLSRLESKFFAASKLLKRQSLSPTFGRTNRHVPQIAPRPGPADFREFRSDWRGFALTRQAATASGRMTALAS